MNGIKILFLIFMAFGGAWPLFAYDLRKPESIEFAQYDAPHQLAEWLKEDLPGVDRTTRFQEWITGFVALLRTDPNGSVSPDPDDLVFAEHMALERGFLREYLFVKRFRLMQKLQKDPGNTQARHKVYEELIVEAQRLEQKGFELLILTELAWLLVDTGNILEGFGRLRDIPKTRPENLKIGYYDWLEILHNSVVTLQIKTGEGQLLSIYRDILRELEKTRPRYFLAATKANFALLVTRMEQHPPDLDPEQLLLDAIRMAQDVAEDATLATAFSALGVYYQKQGRLQDSLTQFQKALTLFKKLDSQVWIGDTYKKSARSHLLLQQHTRALELLDKAQGIFKQDYKQDQLEILNMQQEALAALNQHHEAWLKLEQHLQLYKDTLIANESSELSSRLIDNQIDLEQARSVALEAEAEAKRQKVLAESELQAITTTRQKSLDQLNRGVFYLLALIIVLAIAGRLLHNKTHDVHVHIRENLLQRFVPPAMAHAIASGEQHIEQDPQWHDITVVFARIPHFEELVQKLDPETLAQVLSAYLEGMSEVIFAHGGTIDKFNRGTLMILFGAPLPMDVESQVRTATRCAEAMLLRVDTLELPSGVDLQLAVGIHHGPALVGFFGGVERTDYTAIGATVNMASRIEGLAAPGDIVVSEIIALILKDEEYRLMGHFLLKGIEHHQSLYIWVRQGEQEAVS
jgi:class 3 adenylate cyclase